MALTFQIRVDDQGGAALDKLGKKATSATDIMTKLGIAMVGAFSVAKVIQFGKASVDAYDSSILAATKLKTALGFTSEALLEQASALQLVTRYEDDSITGAQALLATYGLSESQVKRLTPALLNYASVTGNDLQSASDKIGRSIASTTNALTREGIVIGDSTSKSQRLAEIIEQLNKRFEGQAEAAGNVGSGGVIKLKNSFGDLMENVGKGITEFPLFTAAIEGANSVLEIAKRITSDASEEYQALAENIKQDSLPSILDLNEALIDTVKLTPSVGLALGAIPNFANPDKIKEIAESFKFVSTEADATVVNVSASVARIRDAINKDAEKKNKKEVTDTVEGGKDPLAEEAKKYAELDRLNKEHLDTMMRLKDENDAWFKERDDEIEKNMIDRHAARAKRDKERIEAQKAYNEAVIYGAANMLGAFAGLNQALKGNAEASKMLARGSVIIDTAAGIMKAYAQGGVLGFLTGAAIAAVGATQLANIDRQKFSTGGWVSGGGGGLSDNVNASLSPGERVISNRDVDRMGGKQAIDRAIDYGLQKAGGVTININGPVMAAKQYVRDILMPEIETYLARV